MSRLATGAALVTAAALVIATGIASADTNAASPSPTSSPSSTATPLPTISPSPSFTGPANGTSVDCPVTMAELTASQAATAFQLAAQKLASAARGSKKRYPFGALANQTAYVRTGPSAWTSGFFPAELWSMYQATNDDRWLRRARDYSAALIPVANDKGTHDLGFMIGVPMTLATALEPSAKHKRAYLNAEITAAKSLARRYNDRVHAIKSATYGGKWGVIVDSSMNAPMLIEVGQWLGPEGDLLTYEGTQHMLTLARDFIRPNGSTFHRMAFNPRTGALIGPIAGQGLASTSSTWSRGQAWAINGFARSYALTANPELLKAAEATANYWMSRVPPGCVPAWDLDVSNSRAPRDSSAAAIAASGMLALADVEPSSDAATTYRTYARLTLGTLASPGWLNTRSSNPGILLQQSLNVPADPHDGSYVWGDYYLLDAITAALRTLPTPVPTPSVSPSGSSTSTPSATPGTTPDPTPKPSPTD